MTKVAEIILAMDRVRCSPGLDLPPSAIPLTFPTDALAYLNTLLAEREAEGARP